MTGFTFNTPTKIVFGKQGEEQAGALCKTEGATKVLVHFGGGSCKASGLLDRVLASLDAAGIAHVELGGVVPNPELSLVREGIALARKEGVDFVLAVGGGSVIDSAKAICFGVGTDDDVWDFYLGKAQPKTFMGLGTVLTIAAAGSEMSNSSVITNEETKTKLGLTNELSRPRFSILNPELTLTLPPYQTAVGCADILLHTMERYFTPDEPMMEVTAGIAESVLRTAMDMGRILARTPDDYDARAELMWAGCLSHNDLTGLGNPPGDWATHGIGHQLSGKYGLAHGASLSVIWGSWARYVYKENLPRFARFAQNVLDVQVMPTDRETAIAGINEMEEYFWSLELPTSMAEADIHPSDADIEDMAERATKGGSITLGSVKPLGKDDIVKIYQMARGD